MRKQIPLFFICCVLLLSCNIYASPVTVRDLPNVFVFSSGAGGWSTEMTINENWSFAGQFHDSDMGDTGNGYPNGTVYVSDFSGFLSDPEQVSPYALKFELLSMVHKQREGEESLRGGVRYVGATPYGMYGGEEFYLYLPGTPVSELTDDCMSWIEMFLNFKVPAYLPEGFYVFYNVKDGYAFVGKNDSYVEPV